ncbi:MAG TPA: bifunctional isocitrate dehydrogenase kinase/phosphatase [Thermoanaerobaculia bacterium]|nr:bifunctional isocitrate dehydrogenase kinase/phosphatase [Thermoanaerobaculia bacterium]
MPAAPARHGADIIQRGFEEFHESFRAVTRRAIARFESRDWMGIRRDTVRRLGLHTRSVDETLVALRHEFGAQVELRDLWSALKDAFSLAILGSDDCELAQTFFNSCTRRVFSHVGVDPRIDYTEQDFPVPFRGWEMASARMYAVRSVSPMLLRRVLEDAGFRAKFRDLSGDAAMASVAIEESLVERFGSTEIEALDFLRPVFIRNKAAYLVGRARRDQESLPLVIAILHGEDGLTVDAVVRTENEISIIWSFARWYFHADLASPRQVIGFLHSILPRKRVSELYLSLGYNKHGKTEFYRDLTAYAVASDESFVIAPGQRGLVMSVFTLPSYEFVFKVIRDTFPASKATTRRRVMERYRQVLLHDRVGRLVDFQEFEHLKFPQARFAPELLEELLGEAARNVGIEGDDVIIRHLYVGRRVTPLDVFLKTAGDREREAAIVDWGKAVKELAAANIFAGDMLAKNFGVTRHGRVVFYDYDELCPLDDCRFRTFPASRSDDEELSAEPWFAVRDGDVFPEELGRFLGVDQKLRTLFLRHHEDLFSVEFWRTMQERNREGEVIDFFPYAESRAPGDAVTRRPAGDIASS